MASIVFSNPSRTSTATTEIPSKGTIETMANRILSAVNPQEEFSKVVNSNEGAKKAMEICNQYGNGDPKAAFMNYMAGNPGKAMIGKAIMSKLGLG